MHSIFALLHSIFALLLDFLWHNNFIDDTKYYAIIKKYFTYDNSYWED